MAKGFAYSTLNFTLFCLFTLSLASCSKAKVSPLSPNNLSTAETFPIANSELKNCHFKDPNPTYTCGQTITPNPIQCDQGVARSVQILNPNPLPSGIQFSSNQLSLVGTAGERVTGSPYRFYLENEAGYVVLKMLLTVK